MRRQQYSWPGSPYYEAIHSNVTPELINPLPSVAIRIGILVIQALKRFFLRGHDYSGLRASGLGSKGFCLEIHGANLQTQC